MVKGRKSQKADKVTKAKKRVADEVDESESEPELQVEGLIDAEAESEDDESFESAEENASAEEDKEDEEDEEDSDAELNKLLAEEEGNDSESEYNTSDFSEDDTKSMTDKLSGVKLTTIAEPIIKTKFSDGTPRVIKPEINPVYDSDDSDIESKNTIGNIPLSVYDEMPHIGYEDRKSVV